MRVMVIVKADENSEAGVMPDEKLLAAMGAYNEQLVKAGVMEAGEGLHPSSKGKRVRFSGAKRTVIDGPFARTGDLVAGFWILKVKSMEDAVEWVKRCPNPMPGTESELEIRPVFETEDFGDAMTPELRAQEDSQRARIEAGKGKAAKKSGAKASRAGKRASAAATIEQERRSPRRRRKGPS